MADEARRAVTQDADLNQTNDQQVDQANKQDASHRSRARQEVAFLGHQEEQQRVSVVVRNHLAPPAPAPGPGCLEGRVLDVTGTGVAGCVVEVFFGPPLGIPVAVEETDGLGRFQVADLPPGFYSLRATASDGAAAQQWNVRVDAGGHSRAQVCLTPGSVPTHRLGPVHLGGIQLGRA